MDFEYIMKLNNMEEIIIIIRLYVINFFTYYMNFKFMDIRFVSKYWNIIINVLIVFVVTIVCKYVKDTFNFLYCIIGEIILLGYIFSMKVKNNMKSTITLTTISLAINYLIYLISAVICFLFFFIFKIENNYINMTIILIIYAIVMFSFLRIKRIERGIIFLKYKLSNEYYDILISIISCVILFAIVVLSNYNQKLSREITFSLIIFAIMMAITIQKSLQLYYKQKMLVKDLEETKEELEEKNNKIKELETEIIKSGKRSHSISHRQKILEHKLEELSMKSEISEMDIKSRIERIGKDIRKEPVIVLAKTGIVEIDDVLNYMKSECLKKKIDFQLQLSGNIYKMINNYVSKDELEILLADHIKNAIIAIEHSENINKSILVRLGRLDGTYGLYVYDSGIEFEIETFLKLGKKPATTHKDSGGTGMGFMNTFDTLRKHNASFIIEEYGKPVTDNFTKVLKFKFDNKNEFKICTYRKEEIEKQDKEKILNVENLMF